LALDQDLRVDLVGVQPVLPLHLGRTAEVSGDGDRVEPVQPLGGAVVVAAARERGQENDR
jgi:hypothetical protein